MTLGYDRLLELDKAHVWHPFTQAKTAAPAILALGGRGSKIYGADGREYLDLVSSWWVNLHGHGNPAIAKVIAEQAAALEQVIFADFTHEPAIRLSHRLIGHLPFLNRVFFSDDGSTAVEVSIKMACQYWANKGQPERDTMIAFEGGYHGDTVGAMSAGQGSGYFRPWKKMFFPVEILPFPATWDNDPDVEAKEQASLDALDKIIETKGNRIAGLIIEPLIQGASGMNMCRPEFMQKLEAKLRQASILFILDEVMTGFGRTGQMFACLTANIKPDMICVSKGITGGFLPLSATITTEEIFEAFLSDDIARAFLHGHSYTANPIACAAGLASLDLLESPDCQNRIRAISDYHGQRLAGLKSPLVSKRRQIGTIAAFDVPGTGYEDAISPKMKAMFAERGIMMRPMGNVLYILAPYCLTDMELEFAWDNIEDVLANL